MRLTPEQLAPLGVDAQKIHFIDTAFLLSETPDRVGVAVSGGGDSMALLHAAKCWSDLSGVPIEAVTVDHGLRPEAADEAAMVAGFCDERDIPQVVLRWDGASAKGNIAAAGRDARYSMIADWAKSRGIGGVLLGHTQDDVAETFLLRLARKSGVDGLSILDVRFERHGVLWARPFWQQTRADLRDYARQHAVPWVEDPTNEDESHERPKARKVLAALAPLGIDGEVLKSVAINMAGARGALEHYTYEAAREIVSQEEGDIVIEQRPRPPVPPEIQRRLLVAALRFVGGAEYAPRADALVELDVGLTMGGKHTLAGCVCTSDGKTIRVSREFNAVREVTCPLGQIWDRRWQVLGNAGADLAIRALGDAVSEVPDWREAGLPRETLRSSPAVFRGDWLVAAPVAGLQNGFEARIVADFASFLLSR